MMSPHTCVCFQHAGGIIPSLSLMADVWVFFFFKMPTQISVVFRISKLIFFPLLLVFGCFVGVLLLFWGCVFFFLRLVSELTRQSGVQEVKYFTC